MRQSRPLLLAPVFSKFFSRAASNEGRLPDGLSTDYCFFATTELTGTRLFLLFPEPDTDRLQQGNHLLPFASTCRCSRTKEWNSAFSLCRFNSCPFNPPKFKQPIQQLPEDLKSRIFINSNDDFKTKITQSLPNWRTRGNCREDCAQKILKEATTIFAELFSD